MGNEIGDENIGFNISSVIGPVEQQDSVTDSSWSLGRSQRGRQRRINPKFRL